MDLSDMQLVIVVAGLVASAAMAGVIWMVQLVHYPLFARVGADGFVAYEAAHRVRISLIVGPLMGIEALCALGLLVDRPDAVPLPLAWAAAAVLVPVHLTTVLLSVPAHERLSEGFDGPTLRRLVATNWVRTAGWTARAALATAVLVTVLR